MGKKTADKTVYQNVGWAGFGSGSNAACIDVKDGKVVRVEVKSEKGGRFRLVDPRTARGAVPTEGRKEQVGRSPRDRRNNGERMMRTTTSRVPCPTTDVFYPPAILEEELKNRVAADWFGGFDCSHILGKVDFCAAVSATDRPSPKKPFAREMRTLVR